MRQCCCRGNIILNLQHSSGRYICYAGRVASGSCSERWESVGFQLRWKSSTKRKLRFVRVTFAHSCLYLIRYNSQPFLLNCDNNLFLLSFVLLEVICFPYFFPLFFIYFLRCASAIFFFLGSSWNLFRCRTNCYCACVVVPHFCSPSVIDGILALCVLHEPHSSDAKLNENDEQTKLAGMLCYIHYIRSSIPAVLHTFAFIFRHWRPPPTRTMSKWKWQPDEQKMATDDWCQRICRSEQK